MILLVSLALALAPTEAKYQLALDLPAEGVVRVTLPADVVGSDPGQLVNTLTLLRGDGGQVPFTVAVSEPVPRLSDTVDYERLDAGSWRISSSPRWVDTLRFSFADVESAGVVTVVINGGSPATISTGSVDGYPVVRDTVNIPPGNGPWVVEAKSASGQQLSLDAVYAEVDAPEVVPNPCYALPAPEPVLTESGWATYGLDLGGMRYVRSVVVLTDEGVFDRRAMVAVPSESRDAYGSEFRVRRISVGGSAIDDVTLSPVDLGGDRLLVELGTENGRVLPVEGFEICATGAELIVRDAGPGPHTLYVGGAGHQASGDLAAAKVELLRVARRISTTGEMVENPDYQSQLDREGVADMAAPLNLIRWHFARPITGFGWSRIALDRAVLAHARNDLGDLRVVAADDREIPSLLRRTGQETAWETPPFSREEHGSHSQFRVLLGTDLAPVSTITLTTPRAVFSRRVQILRDRGSITEPLRSVNWDPGTGTPTQPGDARLAIAVDQVVGQELLVDIDNGDNPPLPISAISVTSPQWEMIAKIPEGARLVYGAPAASRPSYDLDLVQGAVWRERPANATLGEETKLGGPVLRGFEKMAMLGAVAVLTLGLLAMMARVLFSGQNTDEK